MDIYEFIKLSALRLDCFFPETRVVFRAANTEYVSILFKGLPQLLFQCRRALDLTKRETAKRLGVHVEIVGKWKEAKSSTRDASSGDH